MTVRNYIVLTAIAFAMAACTGDSSSTNSVAIDLLAVPGDRAAEPAGQAPDVPAQPPVPRKRTLASMVPPVPADRADRLSRGGPMVKSGIVGEPVPIEGVEIGLLEEPLFEPRKFYGMSASGVRTLLGPPQMILEQPPSTVWHYRDARCELDLYFYLDVETGEFRVVTFDLVREDAEQASTAADHCLNRIRIAYHGT